MTTRRPSPHAADAANAAYTDAVTRPESDWVDADGHEVEDHDRGLLYDLGTLNRRRVLGLFGGLGAMAAMAACGTSAGPVTGTAASSTSTGSTSSGSSSTGTTSSGSTSPGSTSSGTLTEVPDETAGPYPGDGSNGVDVLDDSGIVRSDIRSSFGTSTTTAQGVPLSVSLTVRDAATGAARAGPPSTSGTATATGTTRCTPRTPRARTTCAGCRRPTPTAR